MTKTYSGHDEPAGRRPAADDDEPIFRARSGWRLSAWGRSAERSDYDSNREKDQSHPFCLRRWLPGIVPLLPPICIHEEYRIRIHIPEYVFIAHLSLRIV
jgi:hypothetical protein